MEYYLRANTKEELFSDLRSAGFEWYDYDEETGERTVREPENLEVTSVRDLGTCIYLEHIVKTPAEFDEEGNLISQAVLTTDFHANVTLIGEHDFSTAIEKPNSPKYGWQ